MRPSAPKPIRPPELPAELEAGELSDLDPRALVEARRLDGPALGRAKASGVRFEGVHVVGGALDESALVNLTWLDVVCERCNLSMIDWRGAKLTRVVFRGCRLTGAKLVEGELESVRFVDCQLDYAAFTGTRLRQVAFDSCQMRETFFQGGDLTGTAFAECDLEGADFGGAKLQGADVSSSRLARITIGAGDVRGLVVSRAQASELARLLGIVVRD